jgi:hypothetical protein
MMRMRKRMRMRMRMMMMMTMCKRAAQVIQVPILCVPL